ncbi:Type 1 glutamine amidotransferase-like domain-containing protein [Rhodococcus sp. IEGM 1366]|uniref:Type 1 glutamine amidotransferase-like domain-containing protein n=1 Tax=Rhodococcus sp. IEGM 1366 TaxID=3082223 RepID=UPI00295566DC|nr:Type 1 glutamine amidotransferase-like domain-containing protein [Rhodococcus sp. IEGM 1366]MDV8070482.1 Type 1 glutamine amidotransferase-like domain-containing protein [Rhodococcus sp. IEGM 1366]
MKLFLASYRFGDHHTRFAELVGPGARIAVIAAAADAWPAAARASAVTSELTPLRRAGYDAEELDIRDYARSPDALEHALRTFDCVWVRGGNTFVLRAQLARTGADDVLERLVRNGDLAYAGYSAGAAVATPTLTGLDITDDPSDVLATCGIEPVWTGLGLVDFAIVPHGGGSVLEDPAATARTIAILTQERIPFRVLSDQQVVVVDGGEADVI